MSDNLSNKKIINNMNKGLQRRTITDRITTKEQTLVVENEGKKFIYPNQQEAADKCVQAYNNGALAVVLVAQPGTGKTGTAQAVMIAMATNPNDDDIILTDNMINCTGMSDKDWEYQFKQSVLPEFREHIYHRQNLIKQKDKLCSLKDGLIITDECHIASESKMTIAKILKDAGILDVNVLKIRNIKMLDISATPDGVLHDYNKWEEKCTIIKLEPGPLYKGFEIMLNENRIIDAPNLEDIKDCYDLLEFLDNRYRNTTKKYYLFRLLDPAKIIILQHVCEELNWSYLNHNSDDRIDKIDTLMKTPPTNHTIIFIKNFWRASKRIPTLLHIGATYEPILTTRDVSVTSQGLTARCSDNYEYSGDQIDINLRPLHFCDKGAIEEYVDWYNNDCDFKKSPYTSRRISSNGKGKVKSKETKVNPKNVSGINNDIDETKKELFIIKFNTQEEAKEYFDRELKAKIGGRGRGPNKRTKNEDGYYEASIKKITKVWSCDEINNKVYLGVSNNDYRLYPCYKDITDNTSVEWWFIHH